MSLITSCQKELAALDDLRNWLTVRGLGLSV